MKFHALNVVAAFVRIRALDCEMIASERVINMDVIPGNWGIISDLVKPIKLLKTLSTVLYNESHTAFLSYFLLTSERLL